MSNVTLDDFAPPPLPPVSDVVAMRLLLELMDRCAARDRGGNHDRRSGTWRYSLDYDPFMRDWDARYEAVMGHAEEKWVFSGQGASPAAAIGALIRSALMAWPELREQRE